MFKPWTQAALAAVLLCAGSASATAPPLRTTPTLTPEQVAELYIRLALRQDVDAAKRLNNFLRPEFGGKDGLELEPLLDAKAQLKTHSETAADELLQSMPKVDAKRAKPAIVAAILRQQTAAASAQCRALSHSLRTNEYVKGQQIASVRYECRILALPASLDSLMSKQGEPDTIGTDALLKGLAQFQKGFDAGQTRVVEGSLDLYGNPGKTWLTGNFSSVIDVVYDGMAGTAAAE